MQNAPSKLCACVGNHWAYWRFKIGTQEKICAHIDLKIILKFY